MFYKNKRESGALKNAIFNVPVYVNVCVWESNTCCTNCFIRWQKQKQQCKFEFNKSDLISYTRMICIIILLISSGQFCETTTQSFLNSRFKWTTQFGKRLNLLPKHALRKSSRSVLVTLFKLLRKPFSKIATIVFPLCEALACTQGQLTGANHFSTPVFRLARYQICLSADQYDLHMPSITTRNRRVSQ